MENYEENLKFFSESCNEILSQQVETIGDAYMVVGGVPVPTDTHAECVANFALGMRIAAREVTSPITGLPIQVCVCLYSWLCVNISSVCSFIIWFAKWIGLLSI